MKKPRKPRKRQRTDHVFLPDLTKDPHPELQASFTFDLEDELRMFGGKSVRDKYLAWHAILLWCVVESTNRHRTPEEQQFFGREALKARTAWRQAAKIMNPILDPN